MKESVLKEEGGTLQDDSCACSLAFTHACTHDHTHMHVPWCTCVSQMELALSVHHVGSRDCSLVIKFGVKSLPLPAEPSY